jgi:lipopolysaccharide/colanic/teichoic acid biosynthesis glycosyltransferase
VLRGFDIVISSLVLLVLSPLLALTAAAVALDSGRPVLYRGMRVGRAGQIFWMY